MNDSTLEVTPVIVDAKRLDRVAKLLHQAENAGTPGEAEMFSQRATELILRYAIDEATLAAHRDASVVIEEIVKIVIPFTGVYRQVQLQSANLIVMALGSLRAVAARGYRERNVDELWVFGHTADVELARVLIASLQLQCSTALATWWQIGGDVAPAARSGGWTAMQRFKVRREFIYSFGEGAAGRIDRARRAALRVADSTPGVALAVRDRRTRVDAFVDALLPNLVSGASSWLGGGAGARGAGLAAGRDANTGETGLGMSRRQVGGSR